MNNEIFMSQELKDIVDDDIRNAKTHNLIVGFRVSDIIISGNLSGISLNKNGSVKIDLRTTIESASQLIDYFGENNQSKMENWTCKIYTKFGKNKERDVLIEELTIHNFNFDSDIVTLCIDFQYAPEN